MNVIYYELLDDNWMKYFISCIDGSLGLFEGCYFYFLIFKMVMVDVYFVFDYLKYIVLMVDKLSVKFYEF